MTKKHFQDIAEILRNNNANQATLNAFVDYFKRENPRFDVKRFLLACGE